MNVLIVHAHPEPKSFNTAMKNLAVTHFETAGHRVQVSDLYEMQFNPVASAADFAQRINPQYLNYALEQRANYQQNTIAKDIQIEVDKVQAADLIIFNFPMYWCSVPAILKGWFDRVLLSGVCYGGKRFYDQGGLKGKKAILSLSVGAKEQMFGEKAIHSDLLDMLRPLLRGTLSYVGMDVLTPFVAYHVPYVSDSDRQHILEQYQQYLLNVDQVKILKFPLLKDYDENFQSKIQLQELNNIDDNVYKGR